MEKIEGIQEVLEGLADASDRGMGGGWEVGEGTSKISGPVKNPGTFTNKKYKEKNQY